MKKTLSLLVLSGIMAFFHPLSTLANQVWFWEDDHGNLVTWIDSPDHYFEEIYFYEVYNSRPNRPQPVQRVPRTSTIWLTFNHHDDWGSISSVQHHQDRRLGNALPSPGRRAGYTFNRWVIAGTSQTVNANTRFTWNATIEGLWTPNNWQAQQVSTHRLTANLNGGHVRHSTNHHTFNIQHGHSLNSMGISLPNPARTGYVFAGWQMPNGQLFNAHITLHNPMTVTAIWQPLTNASVTFDLAGGQIGTQTTNITYANISQGQSFTHANLVLPSTPTRAGFSFSHWTMPNGQVFNRNTVITGHTVVSAVWHPVNTFSVVFDSEGGLLNNVAHKQQLTFQTGQTLTQLNVPLPTPTRPGFHFGGWAMPTGQVFTATTPVTHSFEVDAIWHPVPLPQVMAQPLSPIQPTINETVTLNILTGQISRGGQPVHFPPAYGQLHINSNGVAVIPVRAILSVLLGADYNDTSLFYWDDVADVLTIDADGRNLVIAAGSSILLANGTPRTIFTGEGPSAQPFMVYADPTSSYLYVPIRTIAEAVGFIVSWDVATHTVILTPPANPLTLS